MTTRGVVVDLVFELFVVGFEGVDKALDFDDVDIFVVGVAVDQQWGFEVTCVSDGRAFDIFLDICLDGFADVLWGGEDGLVSGLMIAEA